MEMSFALLTAALSGLLLQPAPHVRALRSRAGPAICAQEGGQLAQLGDQFEAALGSLPASERYNAVLESLLAKQGNVEPALDLVEDAGSLRFQPLLPARCWARAPLASSGTAACTGTTCATTAGTPAPSGMGTACTTTG